MGEGDSELGQIEFETTDGPSVAAPDLALGAASSAKLPALIVALVVGGLLAALIWFSSGGDSSAALDEPVLDQPVGEVTEDAGPDEANTEEQEAEQESVIPESSRASIALEPVRLPLEISEALLVDGELVSIRDGSSEGGPLLAPPISRSVDDGESWEEVETRAVVNGSANTTEYFWFFLRQAGDDLVVNAVGLDSDTRLSFTSTDGIEWEQLTPAEIGGPVFIELLEVTDSYVVAMSAAGSEVLKQFVEDHTTADDVGEVCFVDFSFEVGTQRREEATVMGCDGITEWPLTEETISSEFGPDQVLACVEQLSYWGPSIELSRLGSRDSAEEAFDLRLAGLRSFPRLLSDGRLAGIDAQTTFDAVACDGLVSVEPADPATLYVFDPLNGTVERVQLEPSLPPFSVELLGHVPHIGSGLFLVRSENQLWSLDLDTGDWVSVDANVARDPFVVLSESGRRLYYLDDTDLVILDLEAEGGELVVHETVVFVTLPSDDRYSHIWAATDDRLVFDVGGQLWLLDIPDGLRCAEQFAEALAGNGLVEDC